MRHGERAVLVRPKLERKQDLGVIGRVLKVRCDRPLPPRHEREKKNRVQTVQPARRFVE